MAVILDDMTAQNKPAPEIGLKFIPLSMPKLRMQWDDDDCTIARTAYPAPAKLSLSECEWWIGLVRVELESARGFWFTSMAMSAALAMPMAVLILSLMTDEASSLNIDFAWFLMAFMIFAYVLLLFSIFFRPTANRLEKRLMLYSARESGLRDVAAEAVESTCPRDLPGDRPVRPVGVASMLRWLKYRARK